MSCWLPPRALTRSQRAARRAERRLIFLAAAALLSAVFFIAWVAPRRTEPVVITLYMADDCRRCHRYADYLRARRFRVVVAGNAAPGPLWAEHRWPRTIRATPIGIVRGRLILGHVPAQNIRALIAQPGDALGLVVSGTPAGAPGIRGALPQQFTVYRVLPGGLMQPVDTYNHVFHW